MNGNVFVNFHVPVPRCVVERHKLASVPTSRILTLVPQRNKREKTIAPNVESMIHQLFCSTQTHYSRETGGRKKEEEKKKKDW